MKNSACIAVSALNFIVNLQMVEKSRDELNSISGKIIEFAINVHKELGPGMLEGAYEICLVHELARHGFDVQRQVVLPIVYQDIKLDAGYRK